MSFVVFWGSLAQEETTTTNLCLFNDSFYAGVHGSESCSCQSWTSTFDIFVLFSWGVWLSGMLGNMVIIRLLGSPHEEEPLHCPKLELDHRCLYWFFILSSTLRRIFLIFGAISQMCSSLQFTSCFSVVSLEKHQYGAMSVCPLPSLVPMPPPQPPIR